MGFGLLSLQPDSQFFFCRRRFSPFTPTSNYNPKQLHLHLVTALPRLPDTLPSPNFCLDDAHAVQHRVRITHCLFSLPSRVVEIDISPPFTPSTDCWSKSETTPPRPHSAPAIMPVTIEELDATVRAFYEGRGPQVGIIAIISMVCWGAQC